MKNGLLREFYQKRKNLKSGSEKTLKKNPPLKNVEPKKFCITPKNVYVFNFVLHLV